MANAVVKIHTNYTNSTLPTYNPKLTVVIGGASPRSPGNSQYQLPLAGPGVGSSYSGFIPAQLLSNGIVITSNPYIFPDSNVLNKAPYHVKEQLAQYVDRNIIIVESPAGTPLTGTQIRALT